MPYNPEHDRVTDPDVLLPFLARHPLATLVTHDDAGRPEADLIPLLCLPDADSPTGYALVGHVSRANPLWQDGCHVGTSLAMFGPVENYVSPSWYPSKAEHQRVVPTWNYLVTHAWGLLRVHDDARWVRGVVARLTGVMESGREHPWRMGQAPRDYLEEMVVNIVGIELLIERLEGRFKVSAHRSTADRLGARDGILADGRGRGSAEVADAMATPPQGPIKG